MLSDADRSEQLGQATREKLKQFIARIERLEAEKTELAADIREVYACLLYTSPSPRDQRGSRMPSSA